MELKKRQDDTIANVTTTEVADDGYVIHAEATMASYGRVRFTINLESSGERTSGFCHGSGRGALEDGTYLSGSFAGRWQREGTKAVMHYIVEVSNGDQNLDIAEFDATQNELRIQHFALN